MLSYMLTWLNVYLPRLQKEEGQGMAEYGLLLALIAVVVVVALSAMGDQLIVIFDNIVTQLTI